MKVLVIKLTSMGDVLHLLPALSDLQKLNPQTSVDCMVEDSFAEIPAWHPLVQRVIRVKTRQWRSLNWQNITEFFGFVKELRKEKYDVVIDAQGLMKSAGLSLFAKLNKGGKRSGFSKDSIKESFASYFYNEKICVDLDQHAIARLRKLFAGVFNYTAPADPTSPSSINYQINLPSKVIGLSNQRSIFFLHGTTWPSKHLADQTWRELLDLVTDDGYQIKICWGNDVERERAQWIAQKHADVEVLPKLSLTELAKKIQDAAGVISVDTGLGHLSAALGVPTVSIYGSTNAKLTGALGNQQIHLQTKYPCSPCLLKNCNKITGQVLTPPCYHTLSAINIWQILYESIA